MARTRFITSGTIPSGMTGRELTAAGYAVDKFAAAGSATFLTESSDAQVAAGLAMPGQQDNATFTHLDIVNRRNGTNSSRSLYIPLDVQPSVVGNLVFKDTDVYINDGSLRVNTTGVHVYFVNCTIYLVGAKANSLTTIFGVTDQTQNSGGITGTAATTRSVNLYGCNIVDATWSYVSPSTTVGTDAPRAPDFDPANGTLRPPLTFSDMIQSSYSYSSWGTRNYRVANGGRIIGSAISGPSLSNANPFQVNGGPFVIENVDFDPVTIIPSVSGTAGRATILRDPRFPWTGQVEKYSLDAAPTGTTSILEDSPLFVFNGPSFGTTTPFSSTTVRRTIGAANELHLKRGVYNYAQFSPTIFNNSLARAQDIVGADEVFVYVSGDALDAIVATSTSFGNSTRYLVTRTAARALASITNIYTTNASGRLVSHSYTTAANSTGQTITPVTSGYFDWLSLQPNSTVGSNTLGRIRGGDALPDNFAPILLQVALATTNDGNAPVGGTALGTAQPTLININSRVEYRSYRYDIPDSASTTIAIPNLSQPISAISQNVIATDLVGTRLRTATGAAARATFNTAGDRTVQQATDTIRAFWENRTIPRFDAEPTLSTDGLNRIEIRATTPAGSVGQIIMSFNSTGSGFNFRDGSRVLYTFNGVAGLGSEDGDFVSGLTLLPETTNAAGNILNFTSINYLRNITIGGPNYQVRLPTPSSTTQEETLANRPNLANTIGLSNVTFHREGTYNITYSGATPAYLYIHNPQFVGSGTGGITINNTGTGTVNLAFTNAFGTPAAGTNELLVVPGRNVQYEALPPAQSTRLFVDLSNLPTGAQYRLYAQPAISTTLTDADHLITNGTVGTGNASFIAITGRQTPESLQPTGRTSSVSFEPSLPETAINAIFNPTGTGNSSVVMLVVTHRNMRTTFYGLTVTQNETPASQTGVVGNEYAPIAGTDESLLLADSTNFSQLRNSFVSGVIAMPDTPTPGTTNTLPATSTGALSIDMTGMSNTFTVGNVTLGRPTEADAQLLLASSRSQANYAIAMAQLYRLRFNSVLASTGNNGTEYDVMRFPNDRNVDVSPRVIFTDTRSAQVQFLPGVYRTMDDDFTPLAPNDAVVIYTGLHLVTVNGTSFTEEEVISERRQVTDVSNGSIQNELNSRHLVSGSLVNIGLGLPATDSNGNLLTTPVLPSS